MGTDNQDAPEPIAAAIDEIVGAPDPLSQGDRAYAELRSKIVSLEFAPGDILREADLQETLGLGRTPIREALLRLAREHFVTVMPRRGMFVAPIEVGELAMLFETRLVLEPYAARLAALRGDQESWAQMRQLLDLAAAVGARTADPGAALLAIDRACHEIMWAAAANRFLVDTLDVLYAQSDRAWHTYLADIDDMGDAVSEHLAILGALAEADADQAAELVAEHVRDFDLRVRDAVTASLTAPLAVAS